MAYAWGALCFYGGCAAATTFWCGLWIIAQIVKPQQRNYGVPKQPSEWRPIMRMPSNVVMLDPSQKHA